MRIFLFCLPWFLVPRPLPAQGLQAPRRAAYEFEFGQAWSAAVELPAYGILDLGPDTRPLDVADNGTVLYRDGGANLVRWSSGQLEYLAQYQPLSLPTFMNERNTVVTTRDGPYWEPELRFWFGGDSAPRILAWSDAMIATPHYAGIRDLNDEDQLVLKMEAYSSGAGDELYHVETNLVDLAGGSFTEWCRYENRLIIDEGTYTGGRTYDTTGLNNYGQSVGLVYEDASHTGTDGSGRIYTYQNEYYARDMETVLDFEPWAINDAGTILGQTPPPLSGLVLLDRFGQRDIGPFLPELESFTPRMSNPGDGMEEIIVGPHYFRRMSERDMAGEPTGGPSPDFWHGSIRDLVPDPGNWFGLEATAISASGRIAGTGYVYDMASAAYVKHGFLLVPPVLVPDWNRDGRIDTVDRKFSRRGEPWRFWINDDDDAGDDCRSSADDLPGSGEPDWASPGMDGLRDGVDFFPLLIDLHAQLRSVADPSRIRVRLRQADNALNLVYTRLQPGEVHGILEEKLDRGFGPDGSLPFGNCPTEPVTADGIELAAAFLEGVRSGNRGVLLLEATRASTAPLVVEILYDGQTVFSSGLPLSLSPVGDMLRIINLRNCDPKFAGSDPGPWLTRTGMPPNMPDSFLESFVRPLRTLVHIHGFNWGGDEIPAAHSELFKRFYQAGSNARYLGIIWNGDAGTLDLTGSSLTYNENVINAFITAGYMKAALEPFSGAWTYALAHSLGNMVTSSAIVDHGLELGRYFMLNAAVALESYIGETADRRLMVHPDWKDEPGQVPDYAGHLLSANWSRLFQPEDHRSLLRWKNRFATITRSVPCTHYYSTGEDVLRAGDGDLPALFGDVDDQELVWVYNEMVKGSKDLTAYISTEVHGGWGFNHEYMNWVDPGGPAHPPAGSWERITPDEAGLIDPAGLVAEPFFRPFDNADSDCPTWDNGLWLYGETAAANAHLPGWPLSTADIDQVKNHAKILAEAIPGHSAPAGTRPAPNLTLMENINLDAMFRSDAFWPLREPSEKRDRWLHSDYIRPALPQVFKLYQHCVQKINMMP